MDALFPPPALLQRLGAFVLGAAPETEEQRAQRRRDEAKTALLVKSQRGVILEDLEHAVRALRQFVAAKEGSGGSSASAAARLSRRDQQQLLEEEETKENDRADDEAGDASLSSSPQGLLMESTDEPRRATLTDHVGVVTMLCATLDRCVSHGLRPIENDENDTVKFFGVVKWTCTRVDAIRHKQMVDAMHRGGSGSGSNKRVHEVVTASVEADLPRSIRGFLAAVRAAAGLTNVHTDEGKARAFLRQALNMHVLKTSMSMVLSETNLDLLASYYTDHALFRQRDDVKVFLHLLSGLDELPFAFLIDDPRLDVPPEELPFSKPLPKPKAQKAKKRAPRLIDPEDMVGGRVRLCALDDDTNLLAEKLVSHHELRCAFDSLRGGNPLSDTLKKAAQTQKLEDAAVAVLRFLELGYPEYDVFGTELLDVLCNPFLSGMARFETSLGIPDVAEACICYLYEHLDTPGLFQVHLQADHVMELRDTIEEMGGFHKQMAVDPHEVTAILFQYLWELPDALLTAERLDNFLACAGSGGGGAPSLAEMDASERTVLLRVLVNDLPWYCKPLLERLCHLVHTALAPAHAEKNGLTLYAAANAFAPILLRKRHAAKLDEYEDAVYRKYPVGYSNAHAVRFRLLPSDSELLYASEGERVAAERRLRRHAARDAQEGAQVLSLLFQEQAEVLRDFRGELGERRARLREKVALLESLRFKMEEPIDSTNASHVALLKRLWDALLPGDGDDEDAAGLVAATCDGGGGVDLAALLRSPRWRRSGFHTENPLGGFRGGGLLSLECLVFFLEEYPEKARAMMARNALAGGNRYPFPVASINVLRMLLKLLMLDEAPEACSKLVLHATSDAPGTAAAATVLKLRVAERASRAPFWHVLDDPQAVFKLHSMAFMLLDLHWIHSGATQMGFQPVLDATRRQLGWLLEQAPHSVEQMWTKWMEVREQHAAKYAPVFTVSTASASASESESDALVDQIRRKAQAPQQEQEQQQEEEQVEPTDNDKVDAVQAPVSVEANEKADVSPAQVAGKQLMDHGNNVAGAVEEDPALAF